MFSDVEELGDTATCFVPEMLVEFINRNVNAGKEYVEPTSFFLNGVCLLVDISGFTKLSGDFCGMGKGGIDELQLATNGYMGKLVEIIYGFGGEIIKFAGDAIVCVFSSHFISTVTTKSMGGRKLRRSICSFHGILTNIDMATQLSDHLSPSAKEQHFCRSPGSPYSPGSPTSPMSPKNGQVAPLEAVPAEVVLRAMHCAHLLRDVRTERLTVHVAMSCGEMCFGILGGVENRWECLISGPCIHELSDCLDDAPSRHAVISNACAKVLASAAAQDTPGYVVYSSKNDGTEAVERATHRVATSSGSYEYCLEPLPSGNHRITFVICDTNMTGLSLKFSKMANFDKAQQNKKATMELVKQFVPVPIADQLDSGAGLNYLAEIREVTTMFMKWESYDPNAKHRDLLQLQSCFYEAQKILQKTGAYLRQFLVDDKGCVLIACWGMPHLSYLDNAHRALSAAAQIRYELGKFSMSCSFGITTGDVYCGTVGSALRMEYAAIGSVVNMAARLMCKAQGGILVDDATHRRLPSNVLSLLTALPPMTVKGRVEPLQVYSYSASAESLKVQEKVVEDHEISAGHRQCIVRFIQVFSENAAKTVEPTAKTRRRGIANVRDWVTAQSPAVHALPSNLNTVQVLLIKGREGSGRTTLVKWLRKRVEDLAVPVFGIKLSRKDAQTDYVVWRKLFALLMPKGLFQNTDTQRSYVHALLKDVYPNQTHVATYTAFPVMKETLGITCTYAAAGSAEGKLQRGNSRWLSSSSHSSSKLSGKANAIPQSKVIETLCKIFSYLMNAHASFLVVENLCNADECSLKVLLELLNYKSRSVMVVTALDGGEEVHSDSVYHLGSYRKNVSKNSGWARMYRAQLVNHKASTVIAVENYKPDEIERMLQVALHVAKVPAEVSQLVQDFSGGSCFWVREILLFIKEHGAEQFLSAVGESETATIGTLTAHNSMDDVNVNAKQPQRQNTLKHTRSVLTNISTNITNITTSSTGSSPSHSFQRRASPSHAKSFRTLRAQPMRSAEEAHQVQLDKLVLCRFGSLSTDVQRVLRTASIIGFAFSSSVLAAVLPAQLREHLCECFGTLLSQRWIYQDYDVESLYQFAHEHTYHLIYELTPSSERSITHRQIAEHLEAACPGEKTQYLPLCFHYQHCDAGKALRYAGLAVDVLIQQARVIYDFDDCLELLTACMPSCRSTHDIDELLVLVNNTKSAVDAFVITTEQAPRTCLESLFEAFCGFHATGMVHPQLQEDDDLDSEQMLHAFSENDVAAPKKEKASATAGDKRLQEHMFERRTKTLLRKQLALMYDVVCEKYVDFADAEGV